MLVWSGWSPGSPALRCHPAVAAALWQQLPCAVVQLHETGLPVFLRTISIAASIDFFSNFCFMKNKVVAIAGLSTWSRRMKMQDVFPHQEPLGRRQVCVTCSPYCDQTTLRSSGPRECQENNISEMTESKSSGLPVLLRDCFVSSMTSCYGC